MYLQFKFIKYYFNWSDSSLLNYDKEEKKMHGKFNSLNVFEKLSKNKNRKKKYLYLFIK